MTILYMLIRKDDYTIHLSN